MENEEGAEGGRQDIDTFLSNCIQNVYGDLMEVLTTRVKRKIIEDLNRIGKEEKADRAEVTRKLLSNAITEWKLKKGLEKISNSEWTIRKAADFAGFPYYQMLEEMKKHDVLVHQGSP
ncbi:hypothetical protein AKJ49_00585 [candidate division MSBL1 archaeon SCGC-AAA382A03]|uniref:Uncharacterized protein n=1 Tax=candidate division MSBL1 archaeon SCGC-AAA382A03 TaxID=1698278 RepID=A0A133VGD6_9EURY|nr:hypothetical protein AKJ49_00585 [candidate division MSBL1 archaeon SCGC-AAA382A03]